MASSVLDLIFRTRKTGTGVEDTRSGLTDLNSLLGKLGLGAIGAATAWAALRTTMELANLGADARRADLALAAYTGSAEEAARATQMIREAADGALSGMEATRNAARLFSMGLANTAEEAAHLADIAITLGTSMGRGPQEAFEEFTLLLANQSILRLDTFGISGARVRDRMEELAQQGIEPADRQARFLIATLEEGERRLAMLEAAGYQSATGMERLSASFATFKETLGRDVEGPVGQAADALAQLFERQMDPAARAAQTQRWVAEATHEMADATEDMGQRVGRAAPSVDALTESLSRAPGPFSEASIHLRELVRGGEDIARAFDQADTGLVNLIESFRTNMAWIAGGGLELQGAAQDVMAAFQAGAITQEEANQLLQPIEAAALGLQEDIGQISMSEATRQMAENWGLNWRDANSAIIDARENIETLPEEVRTQIEVAVQWYFVGRRTGPQIGGQHGLDMIVPPGFPNDSFNVNVSSGERVVVQTAVQQQTGGGRGGISIGQLIVNTELDEQILLSKFRRLLT